MTTDISLECFICSLPPSNGDPAIWGEGPLVPLHKIVTPAETQDCCSHASCLNKLYNEAISQHKTELLCPTHRTHITTFNGVPLPRFWLPPLIKHIQADQHQEVQTLLHTINPQDEEMQEDLWTATVTAAHYGRERIVSLLLNSFPNENLREFERWLNFTDRNGLHTSLLHAMRVQDPSHQHTVNELVRYGTLRHIPLSQKLYRNIIAFSLGSPESQAVQR